MPSRCVLLLVSMILISSTVCPLDVCCCWYLWCWLAALHLTYYPGVGKHLGFYLCSLFLNFFGFMVKLRRFYRRLFSIDLFVTLVTTNLYSIFCPVLATKNLCYVIFKYVQKKLCLNYWYEKCSKKMTLRFKLYPKLNLQ